MADKPEHVTESTSSHKATKPLNPKATAWHVADLYRRDANDTKASKKPRLPLSTLTIIADAGYSFEKTCALLEVSPTHLRAASARAEINFSSEIDKPLVFETRVDRRDLIPHAMPKSQKEPDMAAIEKVLNTPAAESSAGGPVIASPRNFRSLTSEERKSIINAYATDIQLKEGKFPSCSRIHRETGYAMETIKKYLERPGSRSFTRQIDITERGELNKGANISGSRFDLDLDLDDEVIQVISEIVFGTDLIMGSYAGPDGAVCFDESIKNEGHSVAMIYEWRQHKQKVTEILAAAREFLS